MKLQAQNIRFELAGTTILDNINFSLKQGELMMLIGPNGSGKTSLIRTLCGELSPQVGELLLESKPISGWKAADRAKKMAVLFQQAPVHFAIGVEQLISLGRYPYERQKQLNGKVIAEVMDCMELQVMAQRSFLSLSGGEQQRVQIARVLAQIWKLDSDMDGVLILDEPLAALDIVYQYRLLQLLQQLRSRGLSILVSIHDLNMASLFADRVMLLDCGKEIATGAPESVFTLENLQQVFKQPMEIVIHPGSGRPQMMFSTDAQFSA